MRKLKELTPITYYSAKDQIRLNCYADTLVYRKYNKNKCGLVAMRFGGYPEHVRGMSDAMRGDIKIQADIETYHIILNVEHKKFKHSVSHDGIYAEGMVMALDDERNDSPNNETPESGDETEKDKKKSVKRKMYIFCEEGDTDALFAEVDKKISIPLIPQFKDYVLNEFLGRGILIPLEVASVNVRLDAYMLEVSEEETEVEAVINEGLQTGQIAVPNATNGNGFKNIKTVSQYLNRFGVTIAERIKNSFHPLFDPANEDICERMKDINANLKQNVGYSLYPAQLAVAEAVKRRLDESKVGIIVAECGSGKTKIGSVALAAHQDGRKCLNVVLCPSHMTKKWVREIEETLPNTKAAVVYSIEDIQRVYKDYQNGDKSVYLVLSKERARDGYMRKPAVVYSRKKQAFLCPHCGEIIQMELVDDGTHYKVDANQFFFKRENNQNHKCEKCGNVLWTALNPNDNSLHHNKWVKIGGYGFVYRPLAREHYWKQKDQKVLKELGEIISNPHKVFIAKSAHRKFTLSTYIAQHMEVDGFLADELHQFKGDSGQGNAMKTLIGCAESVIGMTATLINGYSSGIFYLLYRIAPHLMLTDNKPYGNPKLFNNEYGVTERTYLLPSQKDTEETRYNANSRNQRKLIAEKLKPGVSPLVYSRFLIDSAVFLSLNDMGKHLPDYEEIPVGLNLREDVAKEYKRIMESYRDDTKPGRKNARKVMSSYLSLLTTYSDQPYDAEPILDPDTGEPLIEPKDLSNIDELNEKDVAVLDIVEKKIQNGERVLIYTSWVKIDTQEKLTKLLEDKGYRTAVLQQNVAPDKREEWIERQLEKGIDVLITNPSIVETGLDLNAFTTLIFYNIAYNLFTFRQASRRSWRINQTAPRVEVYILYFKNTMQSRAIRLMASKLAAATLVEGNFSDEGLAALGNCEDMTSELAKALTKGIQDEVEDTAEMFKKMAIIKDVAKPELTVSEKLEQAMRIAQQIKGVRESKKVQEHKVYTAIDGQLSFLDLAS